QSISGEYRYLAQDGRIHWLRMYRRPAWDDNHQRVFRYYTVAQDITARKEAEAALKASEKRYRIVSELISDYAYSVCIQADGSLVDEWMTDSFKNVTGYSWEEMNPNDPLSLYYPDDYELARRDVNLVKQGKTTSGEYRIVTRSGQTRWVLISRHPVWSAAENRVTHYYGVAQDITERKEAESQKMRLALQRERLMLLGQFVRAVSHDFRTTLANIETSRYLIERQLNLDERNSIQPRLDRIQTSVKRLTTQLENLYSVSAVANPNTDLCDVNGLIDALLDEQRALAYQKKIDLKFDRHPFLSLIPANADELKRALRHLVVNSLNFTPEGGQILLRTNQVNDNLIIEVQDTGVGIAEENQPFIFDLFYRADASRTIESGGIGLGLSIVKMIVEAHGGQVTLDSVVGRGTLFVISLPTSQLDAPVTEPQMAHMS
ncbi:MAG TPA: ATP-binding protein, partial [Phototrophicaceae bacterium]|nr:ATP-binding protein [Phototrophicaceae bacterium]